METITTIKTIQQHIQGMETILGVTISDETSIRLSAFGVDIASIGINEDGTVSVFGGIYRLNYVPITRLCGIILQLESEAKGVRYDNSYIFQYVEANSTYQPGLKITSLFPLQVAMGGQVIFTKTPYTTICTFKGVDNITTLDWAIKRYIESKKLVRDVKNYLECLGFDFQTEEIISTANYIYNFTVGDKVFNIKILKAGCTVNGSYMLDSEVVYHITEVIGSPKKSVISILNHYGLDYKMINDCIHEVFYKGYAIATIYQNQVGNTISYSVNSMIGGYTNDLNLEDVSKFVKYIVDHCEAWYHTYHPILNGLELPYGLEVKNETYPVTIGVTDTGINLVKIYKGYYEAPYTARTHKEVIHKAIEWWKHIGWTLNRGGLESGTNYNVYTFAGHPVTPTEQDEVLGVDYKGEFYTLEQFKQLMKL